MGNWIPGDPTLVAQILRISSAYSPPPPEGFVSPMTWGVDDDVSGRFTAAGVPAREHRLPELVALFEAQNESGDERTTAIPATFLRVTVSV